MKASEPDYPQIAMAQHVTGTFAVKATLDAEGLVQSIQFNDGPSGEGAAIDSLRASSVVAAGSSTYAPAIADCRAVGGTYIFRSAFTEE